MTSTHLANTSTAPAVARVVQFFETLTPDTLSTLDHLYDRDTRFKDPFNDVRGLPAVRGVFTHMFASLDTPRFVVLETIVQGHQCFLTWEFHFGFKRFRTGEQQVILGGSHLVFSPEGKITLHRDYWDAAEELYEKLPWIGGLMRWLKKRANS